MAGNADELRVLLTAKDDLSQKLKDVRSTVKSLEKDMASANAEFRKTGDQSALTRYQDLYRQWEKATASQKEYAAQLRRTSSQMRNFGTENNRQAAKVESSWKKHLAGMAAMAAGAFSVDAVIQFGKASVLAYADAEQSQLKLQNAYSKFPQLADVSLAAMQDLNAEMMRKLGIDDDELASSEAILAQFKLTGTQIRNLMPLLADYALKQGVAIPDAAGMLGKALMGNTRALKAIGVNYKATGDAALDYANITQALREKVGGFAEEESKTAAGQLRKLETLYGNLQETVGEGLVPALEAGLPVLQAWVDQFTALIGPMNQFEKSLVRLLPEQVRTNEAGQTILDWAPNAVLGLGALGLVANQLRYPLQALQGGEGLSGVASAAVRAASGFNAGNRTLTTLLSSVNVAATATKGLDKALGGLTGAMNRWQSMQAYRQALKAYVKDPTLESASAVVSAMQSAADSFKKPKNAVKFTNQAIKSIGTAVRESNIDGELKQRLLDLLDKAGVKVRGIKDDLSGLNGATVTVTVLAKKLDSFFAAGGLVTGPGTGTSDSISARLSNGEYVVRAAAVRALGVDQLERINRADMVPVAAVAARGSDGASAPVAGPTVTIGTINAAHGVDVQGEVLHAMMRADRIARERR